MDAVSVNDKSYSVVFILIQSYEINGYLIELKKNFYSWLIATYGYVNATFIAAPAETSFISIGNFRF